MPLNLRLYHTGVSGMREMFDKKVESHRQLQLENPFSEWGGEAPTKRRLSKDDKYYGRYILIHLFLKRFFLATMLGTRQTLKLGTGYPCDIRILQLIACYSFEILTSYCPKKIINLLKMFAKNTINCF